MSVGYQIEVNQQQLAEVDSLLRHIKADSDKALTIGANKAGPKIRTLSSKKIREQVRLKAGYVSKHLKFERATKTKPAKINTPSRGMLLSRFSTDALIADPDRTSWIRPPEIPARGIRVKVKPSGSATTIGNPPGTVGKPFYLILKNSGRVGIAFRRAKVGKEGGKLDVRHGPSLSQVFNGVKDEVLPEASAEFQRQVHEAALFLVRKEAMRE
jgi:hypothetical protein